MGSGLCQLTYAWELSGCHHPSRNEAGTTEPLSLTHTNPDARLCVLLANKRLDDKPVKQLLNLTSPGNPCQEKTAIQTVTERDNLSPKGRQYVAPAVRPGKLDVVTMSAEGAAQSECRSFGP